MTFHLRGDAHKESERLLPLKGALPETGGIGTTIFTVGGCAIKVVAAALFFMNKKKHEKYNNYQRLLASDS